MKKTQNSKFSEFRNSKNYFNKFLNCFCILNRKADIALIGLAVMGQNLILNMDDHGFVVCAYNRTVDKVSGFNIKLVASFFVVAGT